MRVEIRAVERKNDNRIWQELWIDDGWKYSTPGIADGNTVAHIIARHLRDVMGVDITYKMVDSDGLYDKRRRAENSSSQIQNNS